MATSAMLGHGTLFKIGTNATPPVYTTMAEVKNVTPPSFEADQVDVTHNESPNRTREFIAGLKSPGECSFEMNFVPGSASDDKIMGLLDTGDTVPCQIEFPNAVVWAFLASVRSYEISSATEEAMTATVGMTVSGEVTVTP